MNKRTTSKLAVSLSFVLMFGPSLSLASEFKESKKPVYFPLNTKLVPGPKVFKPASAVRVQASVVLPGQTLTLLPDGRSLLIGGEGPNGPHASAAVSDARTGEPVPLSGELHYARAWHSATMLPDGRMLIIGGVGADGRVVNNAEVFHPESQTFELLTSAGLPRRAYHTATLLTDGQVLITGGVSAQGRTLDRVVLWDFKTDNVVTLPARLSAARQKHKATLLSDGNVLIEGGRDGDGNEVSGAELYDAGAKVFSFTGASSEQPENNAPYLAASLPADGATDVAVESLIALRFSKRLAVGSVNSETITLAGSEGTVESKVVPAEDGKLAFVTPKKPLLAGMTYTVSLSGAFDETNQSLSPGVFSFTTKKEQEESDGQPADEEDWIPDASNLHGDWKSKHKDSPWRSLPLLEAGAGVTALAGQVLTLDGKPLRDVTLRIAGVSAQTDNTGRFLLAPLAAGHQVMVMDGRTASRGNKVYGIFRVGVDILAGKTNPLGYTVWMPKLDVARATTVAAPTTAAMTITNPHIPGLELRLPPGTLIRDIDGQNVTQISITPIPTNRTPFPLPPNVDVPVYFTIQPGGSQVIPPRAQLIYPNFLGSLPGTRMDFYNYDPTEKGWYIYGQGTVSADGKQIVPDAGVVLYEFSGAMIASPSFAPTYWVPYGSWSTGGYGVNLATGLFVNSEQDLFLPGLGAISLGRTYRPGDTVMRAFGIGSSHPYDIFLVGNTFPYTYMNLVMADGSRIYFNRISAGTGYADAVYEHLSTDSCFYGSRIAWNGDGWNLSLRDESLYIFREGFGASRPQQSALVGMRDHLGNSLTLTRNALADLTGITSPSGRWVQFLYDANNRITQARDNIGRAINYAYDASGRLASVTHPGNVTREYTYDALHRMTQIKDARTVVFPINEYDGSGRIIKQTLADATPNTLTDNPTYQFAYTVDSGGRITQTDVTDPRGLIRRSTFNTSGYTLTETAAVGQPEQQTVTYTRDEGTNRITSVTDQLGRRITYTHDSHGRLTETTSLAGTSEAVTTHYGYAAGCSCDDVTSVTNALNRTTTFEYDDKKNLVGVINPDNERTSFGYNSAGQRVWSKDALNHMTQFTYEDGDLVSVTDPRNQSASGFVDGAGRVLSVRTPLGQAARYEYDDMNRPVKATDTFGGVTEFAYDANGNLLSVKDARNNLTSYTYDNMNRLVTRTDPQLRVESYEYDTAGSLKKYTDRRGKVTSYVYDDLHRMKFVGFGTVGEGTGATYESTITYTYDAAGRIAQVVDSASGTTTYSFDNFDRVTQKATPQGTITYTYDGGGRRTGMTVAGQAAVTYTYDDSNRLTRIAQGTNDVNFEYDDASRVTKVSLANGIAAEYGYDAASNLTSMIYKKGTTTLGDLSYEYDAAGKRTKMGGSLARTGLPQALTSASYNASNQLTQRAGATFTYDHNGNLTGDGTNTYTWDARNRLSSMSGPGLAASFQYDASGNRTAKTVNGVTTAYLYDGANAVQELSGTTPSANMLMGGVDKTFTRTDASGSRTPVTDGQGSTLALADDSGALQTQYSYDPFGNTTATGATSTNASKYTGREDDGTGLYYYRARYYSPSLQRFISEDPAEFGGGDVNFYAYVGNDPVNYTDPTGLARFVFIVGDPGLGGRNVGNNFLRAAETRASALRRAGHEVIIARASSVRDFNAALINNGLIDGGVVFFGHGSSSSLFIGELPLPGTNLNASNVRELSNRNLGDRATVVLFSCNSGVGGSNSIAQTLANQLRRRVFGADNSLRFSGRSCSGRLGGSRPGERPPDTGPLFMCNEPGGTLTDFIPEGGRLGAP